jgi:hypothetical protein
VAASGDTQLYVADLCGRQHLSSTSTSWSKAALRLAPYGCDIHSRLLVATRGHKWWFTVASGNSQLQATAGAYDWRLKVVHNHLQLLVATRGNKGWFVVASGNSQLQSATRAYD